jgi:ribosomal protein S27AE
MSEPTKQEKDAARSLVARAIRRGEIVKPAACPRCERTLQVIAHHSNYAEPLAIEWLCQRCHVAEHVRLGWGIIGPKGARHDATRPETTGLMLRLADVRGDMTKSNFGRLCGIAAITYWKYEHGTIAPGIDALVRIARAGNVDLEWLATGDGDRSRRAAPLALAG